MTTTNIINEREAVEITASLDTTRPDFGEAVNIAMSRRGSRDALVVRLAQNNEWTATLDVFHELRSGNVQTNSNIDAIYAIAHAVAGSPAIASAVARLHPDNKMLELLNKLIERKVPINEWLDRMATLDIETCYRFDR